MRTQSYYEGKEAKLKDIREMGFDAARDKFNMDNPIGCKYESQDGFMYASGEMDALVMMLK